MRLRTTLIPAAGVVAAIALATPAHANSICVFSGLEDGDGAGFPGPGGAPPQNWGHVQRAERAAGATPADLKASGFQPGDSCNGHRGFLATGEPE